jgi:hypothetical protein
MNGIKIKNPTKMGVNEPNLELITSQTLSINLNRPKQ